MKKCLAALLILALLLPLAAALADADNSIMYVIIGKDKVVNVRSEPKTGKNIIGKLKNGKAVKVIEYIKGWYSIQYNDGIAYIQSRFLSSDPPEDKDATKEEKEKAAEERKRASEMASEKTIDDPFTVVVRATRASGWINIRKGPSKLDSRVETCANGIELEAIGETDNWYKIRDNNTGKTGYIYKTYVTVIPNPPKPETATDAEIGRLDVNGEFTLEGVLPPGYKLQVILSQKSRIMANLYTEDDVRPRMRLTITHTDQFADVERMNDLTEEQLEDIRASYAKSDQVEFSESETHLGTKLLVAREVGDNDDYVAFLSVYKGYAVEFVLTPNPKAEDQTLTDEQVEQCIVFLTDLDFIPTGS